MELIREAAENKADLILFPEVQLTEFFPCLLYTSGQTRRKVGLVTLDKVLAGEEVIEEALAEQKKAGCEVIVVDGITPVSYTHLDVYKRQIFCKYRYHPGWTVLLS